MAETLTIDPNVPAEIVGQEAGVELTSDEKDSLELGEKMVQQQEELLAGKYKNAEELEKAYVELQSKLGEKKEDSEEKETTAEKEEEPKTEEAEISPAVSLLNEANDEYFSNDGKLSEETIDKFSSLSSKDLVKAYLEATKNNPPNQSQESVEVSDNDINVIQNSVGGEDAYGKLTAWAGSNLDSTSIEAFDNVVATGNVQMIKLAVAGLKAQYDNENGYEGKMLTGKAAATSKDVFRSQAELVRAMNDPKYEDDPAYRQDVIEKLDRSDLSF